MMEKVLFADKLAYNNILYIGDNARECLKIIEKFTARLRKIENLYPGLFDKNSDDRLARTQLQHHIQYHFEGGIAIFRFKNEDELPTIVRNECLVACQSLVFEQLLLSSLPAYPLN
jgi:hypothetical protein